MKIVSVPTRNAALIQWVREMEKMCQPDLVVWIDGSEEEKKRLEQEGLRTGELIELDQKKWPGCLYHRSHPTDVARSEKQTFICTPSQAEAGPTNNWMSPHDGYHAAGKIFARSMKGRTMYVVPFSMGPVGSPFSKIGVELTDSLYVVLNMRIMAQVGQSVLDQLGPKGEFTRCLHGKADLHPDRRLILHFPQDNAVWSVGSGYGGNALLGKKCLALRIASYLGRKEGWMAEHMLILGIERPGKPVRFIAAAFPSACGKTNLSMLVPPEIYKKKGYKIWTVGDDIAWMRIGPDGQLWAINPEAGFFGVVPGTSSRTNPNAVETIRRNTIFTNVGLTKDRSVWWEGADGEPPQDALDWRGNPWNPSTKDSFGKSIPIAHANSRFTAPFEQCPSAYLSPGKAQGVPISAILFGGRRPHVQPLVYESYSWNHGVFMGATVASERTAAAEGTVGEVRFDPMSMLPFCGYDMAQYFAHWIEMGKKISKPPKVFHVNWFRTDEKLNFLWPGFGENLRVLDWILSRCEAPFDGVRSPVGIMPAKESLNLEGLNLAPGAMDQLLSINRKEWIGEQKRRMEFFRQFPNLPLELHQEWNALNERLAS